MEQSTGEFLNYHSPELILEHASLGSTTTSDNRASKSHPEPKYPHKTGSDFFPRAFLEQLFLDEKIKNSSI